MEKKLSKEKIKRCQIWLIIVSGLFIIISLIGVIFTIRTESNTPVRDINIQIGERAAWFLETRTARLLGEETMFFDNVEESLYYHHSQETGDLASLPLKSEKVIYIEEDNYIFSVFPSRHWQGSTHMVSFLFQTQGDYISYPLYVLVEGVQRSSLYVTGIWYDEDRIARDLISSYVARGVTSIVNSGTPIYYGAGIGLPPQQILILGYEPDNIIHFEYNGEDYFFWYYLSNPGFCELISANIDLSSKTLGEIIELFDIQVISGLR